MTPPLTYAQFLAVFVVVPIAALLFRGVGIDPRRRRSALTGTAVMVCIATAWTVPWDNYLVARGVWGYGDGTVVARLVYAPVEEYLFIALQPVLTALWLYRRPLPEARPRVRLPFRRDETVVAGGWLAVAGVGALGLAGSTFYAGAILAWATPPLALQWSVGGRYLWAVRRRVALAVGAPTLYLCVADRLAIGWGIWELSPEYTTGIHVAGLPVEEAVFFVVTNLLVVQGLLLYHRVVETRVRPGADP